MGWSPWIMFWSMSFTIFCYFLVDWVFNFFSFLIKVVLLFKIYFVNFYKFSYFLFRLSISDSISLNISNICFVSWSWELYPGSLGVWWTLGCLRGLFSACLVLWGQIPWKEIYQISLRHLSKLPSFREYYVYFCQIPGCPINLGPFSSFQAMYVYGSALEILRGGCWFFSTAPTGEVGVVKSSMGLVLSFLFSCLPSFLPPSLLPSLLFSLPSFLV